MFKTSKLPKRIISVALVLSLCMSMLCSINAAATNLGSNITTATTLADVLAGNNYYRTDDQTTMESDLLSNVATTADATITTLQPGTACLRYTKNGGSSFDTAKYLGDTYVNKVLLLTNNNVDAQIDIGISNVNLHDNADELCYIDFVYRLNDEYTLNNFVMQDATIASRRLTKYSVYASNSTDNLFDEGSLIATYDVGNNGPDTAFTNINMNGTTAEYVAIRFIKLATDNANADKNIRAKEIMLFGEYVTPASAVVTATTEDGVPSSLISKAEPTYTGTADANGNYASGFVALTATEFFADEDAKKAYTFKGWYNGEKLVSASAEYSYDLKGGNINLIAKYGVESLVKKHTVTFIDATKKVVGEIKVEDGQFIDLALVNEIVIKDFYGYKVKRDANNNVVWDNGFDKEITGDITYTAQYEAIETLKTIVNVYDVDGSKYLDNREVRFDTKINLVSRQNAEYWADAEGNVLVGEPDGYLYACGKEMNIYAKKGAFTTPAVAIVGKDHKEAKGFTVFAHVNVENAVKYGVVYASKTGVNLNEDFGVEDASKSTYYQKVEIDANDSVDFMGSLKYKDSKPNPERYARAYVVALDDNGEEVYYYTSVVCNWQ